MLITGALNDVRNAVWQNSVRFIRAGFGYISALNPSFANILYILLPMQQNMYMYLCNNHFVWYDNF